MNIRSLTRGDGVVIGAAVLLFIASFLDSFECDGSTCANVPNAWDNGALLLGLYLAGVIGAALIVFSRSLSQPRKFAGLEIGQFGVAFTIFAAWTSLGAIFDPAGPLDGATGLSAGSGLILGLLASFVLAGAAVATPLMPFLKSGLIKVPKPPVPQPYGGMPYGGQPGGPAAGYGYPAAQAQGQSPAASSPQGAAPAFSAFWFAVPVARPLYGEDGSPTPIAELTPGTWYLAVDQRGSALVAQTQDGHRGVLQDTTGIQRG